MKRVKCLYRVSTKKQLDKDDDLSMQKNECREFIEKQKDWILIDEYYEKGISGYKVSAKNRDAIQHLLKDAEDKKFDVLLVFMFDRLGRKEDETPFVMQDFARRGIELWSTKEGEQKFDTHADKLINYVRGWQSAGESEKISFRVDASHKQMVENGEYRGGKAPYGYKTELSNKTNKKGLYKSKLVIYEQEAAVIKQIYDLVYNKGYGSNRIQQYLNEKNIPSPSGNQWSRASLQHVLTNPIYKGYLVYGKRNNNGRNQSKDKWILSQEPIDELIIIEEYIWEKVQQIRNDKNPKNRKDKDVNIIGTSSPLLLIGFIRCGHCGSIISTTYNYCRWTKKNGEKCVTIQSIYRCNGRVDNRINCDGQTTYKKDKIENIVIKQTKKFTKNLQCVNFSKEIENYKIEQKKKYEVSLVELRNKLNQANLTLSGLKEEVKKIVRGEKAKFDEDFINEIKEETEDEILNINSQIEKIMIILKEKDVELNEIIQVQKNILGWGENFDKADIDEKRVLLSKLIDKVTVFKDKVVIDYKVSFNKMINNIKEQQYNSITGQSKGYVNTVVDLYQKQITIYLDKVV